jgi:hypothetical protein
MIKMHKIMDLTKCSHNSEENKQAWEEKQTSKIEICGVAKFDFYFDEEGPVRCRFIILKNSDDEVQRHFQLSRKERSKLAVENKIILSQRRPYSEYIRIMWLTMGNGLQSVALILEDIAHILLIHGSQIMKSLKPNMMYIPCRLSPDQIEPCVLIPDHFAVSYLSDRIPGVGREREQIQQCVSWQIQNVLRKIPTLAERRALEASIEQMQKNQRMIKDRLSSSESQVRRVSNGLIHSYIERFRANGDRQHFLRCCNRGHNSLVHAILTELQESLHKHVKNDPFEEQRIQSGIFLERVFHISIENPMECLNNHLQYRLAMYKIILKIMENNSLKCEEDHKETSLHAPLPLMMLVLWRVDALKWDGLDIDRNTKISGIFHQLQVLVNEMGMDKAGLEEAYKMAQDSIIIPIRLGNAITGRLTRRQTRRQRRTVRRRIPDGQNQIVSYLV